MLVSLKNVANSIEKNYCWKKSYIFESFNNIFAI